MLCVLGVAAGWAGSWTGWEWLTTLALGFVLCACIVAVRRVRQVVRIAWRTLLLRRQERQEWRSRTQRER